MTTKISRNEKGNIITVDSKTGKKVGDILTMGDVMVEVEEKRKMREKVEKMLQERKHPKK